MTKILLHPVTRLDDLERQSKNLRSLRAQARTPQVRRNLGDRIDAIEAEITSTRKELH